MNQQRKSEDRRLRDGLSRLRQPPPCLPLQDDATAVELVEGFLSTDGRLQRASAVPVDGVLTTLDLVLKFKSYSQLGVDALKTLLTAGEDEEEYAAMRQYVATQIEPCNPEVAAQLRGVINLSYGTVVYYRLTSDALSVLGLLGGSFTTLAESAFKVVLETFIGEMLDVGIGKMTEDEVGQTKQEVFDESKRCSKLIAFVPMDHRYPSATPNWIYDPSGFVYEAVASERLEDVTATVLSGPSPDGPWAEWDAEAFGQSNPQRTTADGRYGWDVPKGWWKVRYEKTGYRTAYSRALQVLPEHYDVDVSLHKLEAPALATATVTGTGVVELGFTEWMKVSDVRAGLAVTSSGDPVAGTLTAFGEQLSPSGVALAKTYVFTPAAPLSSGQSLQLTLPATTADHGDVPLGAAVTRTVTAPTLPVDPASCALLGIELTPAVSKIGSTVKVRVSGAPGTTVRLQSTVDGQAARSLGERPVKDGRATWEVKVEGRTTFVASQAGCRRTTTAVLTVK